jgi:hypothetical protein
MKLKKYGKKSNNLSETLEYFLFRNKWTIIDI